MPIVLARVNKSPVDADELASWAAHVNAGCVLLADDSLVADSMKRAVLEMSAPPGLRFHAAVVEDMVVRIEDGEFDFYNCILLFSSLKDAMRASVSGLKFDRLNIGAVSLADGDGLAAGPETVTKEDYYAMSRLSERGVEIDFRRLPGDSPVIFKDKA